MTLGDFFAFYIAAKLKSILKEILRFTGLHSNTPTGPF
jgi:hypothetical protein